MGPRRDGEADPSGVNYPSPGAEAMDSGPFYNAGSRDDTQENGGGEDGQHDDGADDQVPPVGEDHGHHHMHDVDEDAQHETRPANMEELQLAAQLGQGLAGAAMLPATDPNMSVEDGGMRNMMSHADSDHHATPSYVHDTPGSDHLVQHSMQVPLAQYSMADGVPPRKRSKVSRACDECRRKKIKCDAQSDTGDAPCSSCARSATRCLFSRVPQKRGPSKGYIKELADRINSIESKLESEGGLSQDEIDKLFTSDRHRGTNGTTASDEASRKRPYSSISNEYTTPVTIRQAPWGSEPRSIQPAASQTDTYYGNSSLAPQPCPINETSTKLVANQVENIHMDESEHAPSIDEGVLNDFLTSVQSLYPILCTSKTRQEALLAQCPLSVRAAFEIALLAVGQSTAGDVQQASALLHDWENNEAPRTRAINIVHAQALLLLIIDADWRSVPTLPFLLSRAMALANSMKLWRLSALDMSSSEEAAVDSDHALCTRIWWSLVGMDRWYAAGTGKPAQIPDSSVVAPTGLETVLGETCFYFTRLSKLLNRISFVISRLPSKGATTTDPDMAAMLTDYLENFREDLPRHMDAASAPLVHLAYWHCRLLITLLTPGSTAGEAFWPTAHVTRLLLASAGLRSPLVNHYVSLAAMSITTLCRGGDGGRRRRLSAAKTTTTTAAAVVSGDETAATVCREARALARQVVDAGGDHWAGVRDRLAEVLRLTAPTEGGGGPEEGVDAETEEDGEDEEVAEVVKAAAAAVAASAASHGLQHLADLATAHEAIAPAEGEAAGGTLASGYLEVA